VINAIGVVKQRHAAKESIASIETNALFPHRLALACRESNARLVHLSTDCVFSGRRGRYAEDDFPDADDLYGRTKLLGEVGDTGCVTLRTSIIGLELSRRKSLVEWFLAQRGPIRGYRRAIYTGFTTLEMARIVERVLQHLPARSGVYQASSAPIDKYRLLVMLRDRLGRDLPIEPDDDFHCDRSLLSPRFQADFAYTPPDWPQMIDELAQQIQERYP
jgi:dTDP-4-dehydrorhamnose reductase